MSLKFPISGGTRLLGVATTNPGKKYLQKDLLKLFGVNDPKIARLFNNSHIASRNLCLPDPDETGNIPEETSLELWHKHRAQSLVAGETAIENVLKQTRMNSSDIDYLACVTSTGFLCPGLTAYFVKKLGFKQNVHRIDLVGMGCNAGLNGMQPLVNYCNQNAECYGLLVCVEICSSAYLFDNTMRTAVVNSLFGDGCAAAVFGKKSKLNSDSEPEILGFESHIIPDQIEAMRFDYDGNKNSFFLDRNIPYILGNNVAQPVLSLLNRFTLKIRDIKHWIIHSGGKKVLDSIKCTLNISTYDIRHTESVLRAFGNLSSGSFLFSYKQLIEEKIARSGDYLLMITMGPGATIECCLGQF
ncbi:MAG TPA: 3,5-dihydroxyphenylacetyl-CoA synthase DpgA [Candidatus Aquirickettsiella sp.]|jgi:predicted naringenin-chalcone synthase